MTTVVTVPQASPSHHVVALVASLIVLLVALVGLGFAIQHALNAETTTAVATQQLASTYRYHDLVPLATKTTVQLSPSYAYHDLVPAVTKTTVQLSPSYAYHDLVPAR